MRVCVRVKATRKSKFHCSIHVAHTSSSAHLIINTPLNSQAAQREARKQGKNPYYLKKSDKRKLELLERYKELSSAGKVDQYLEKRRKRSAAKDHKLVPSTRRSAMGAE